MKLQEKCKLGLALDVRNVFCPVSCVKTNSHRLHIENNNKKEVKPRYRIHELSRYIHILHTHSFTMSEGARNKLRD